MQEEVENRTPDADRQRHQVYRQAIQSRRIQVHGPPQGEKAGEAAQPDSPVTPKGKQTVKQLIGQNQGVSNIEINDPSSGILNASPASTAWTMR